MKILVNKTVFLVGIEGLSGLPAPPGGGGPPALVNGADEVTCQCAHTHGRVRAGSCGKWMLWEECCETDARRLLAHSSKDNAHTSYVISCPTRRSSVNKTGEMEIIARIINGK